MTAEQAKQALKEGKKVRYSEWGKSEHLFQEIYMASDDYRKIPVEKDIFEQCKEDKWEIVE